MICPYCKKKITKYSSFCPNCGQDILNDKQQEQLDSYWESINQTNIERLKKYKRKINKERKALHIHRSKVFVAITLLIIILIVGVFGILKFLKFQSQMINQVKEELVGNTLTTHSSHVEGLGWIYHEYWQLSFVDEKKLDYAYIKTLGPAEEDEKPHYQGTYSYCVSRSITGKYKIKVNDAIYDLKVNENNIPESISR